MISQPFSQTFQAYDFRQFNNNSYQDSLKNIPITQSSIDNTQKIHSIVNLEEINSLIKILNNKISEIESKNKELALIEAQLKCNEPELPKQADPEEIKELEDIINSHNTSIFNSFIKFFKPK